MENDPRINSQWAFMYVNLANLFSNLYTLKLMLCLCVNDGIRLSSVYICQSSSKYKQSTMKQIQLVSNFNEH